MELWTNRWATVDLAAIKKNYDLLRGALPQGSRYLSIMKADAYGHGALKLAPVIDMLGADWFGVATLSEAVALRRVVPQKPILILGYTSPRFAAVLAEYHITQAVVGAQYARELSAAAAAANVVVDVHLKVDIGMGRIGLSADDPQSLESAVAVCHDKNLRVTGTFTHFPAADELAEDSQAVTQRAFEAFCGFCDALKACGCDPGLRHCANSATALLHPERALDMVRAGIVQFGMPPSPELAGQFPLAPAMALHSIVTLVKELPAGGTVSYGRTFTAEKPTRVATVAIGYADGFRRLLGNGRFSLLLHGQRAPVIGRVCMDQIMLDVSAIPQAAEGDIVTIIGSDGNETNTFDDMAAVCGTINYEMTCLLGERVTRDYINEF